ncbi:MAG: hypothetical protein WCX74_04465 [Candidatus Paceibacterota bacterium]
MAFKRFIIKEGTVLPYAEGVEGEIVEIQGDASFIITSINDGTIKVESCPFVPPELPVKEGILILCSIKEEQ